MIGKLVRRIRACVAVAARAMLPVAALGVATFAAMGVAKADTSVYTFDFSYSGNNISAMGTLTATLTSTPGQYQITGITGYRNGATITGLLPVGSFQGYGKNNNILIFPKNPGFLDVNGFAYTAGGANYNPEYFNGRYNEGEDGGNVYAGLYSLYVTVPAPIPGGGLLSFLALGVAGLAWRRRAIAGFGRRALARYKAKPPAPAPAA